MNTCVQVLVCTAQKRGVRYPLLSSAASYSEVRSFLQPGAYVSQVS